MNVSFLPSVFLRKILRMFLLMVLMMVLGMGLSMVLSMLKITKLIITITGKMYKYFFSTIGVEESDVSVEGAEA